MSHQISAQKPIQIPQVLRLGEFDFNQLSALLARFDLKLDICTDGESIPGSYWGDDEAGLRANHLYARSDTPVHSILHEACHYICVSAARRQNLDTNAGSDNAEETQFVTCRSCSPDNSSAWAASACLSTWIAGATVFGSARARHGSITMPMTL